MTKAWQPMTSTAKEMVLLMYYLAMSPTGWVTDREAYDITQSACSLV